MQFERLRKNHKKDIIIGAFLLIAITSVITYTTTRAKYKLTENIKLVNGNINYKPYDFKIMAMYKSEDRTNYTEINDRMPSSGYVINESKSYCTLDNKNKDTEVVLKTISGNHVFNNLTKSDKCYLYFDKKTPENIPEIIASLNVNINIPTFSTIADTDEGAYKVSDGMYGGTSYYWRGAATTNHVIFADKCWRIVRINGDKTMRLIYNGSVQTGNTCTGNGRNKEAIIYSDTQSDRYYATSDKQHYNSSYVGWTYNLGSQRTTSGTASNAKTQTEKWYNANITGTNASKVADGKFCNDRNVQSGSSWAATGTQFYYVGMKRLQEDYNPTLSCPSGDIYTLKVGAITADEVVYAGGKAEDNQSYYLYTGEVYWTMTPFSWNDSSAVVFFVDVIGNLNAAGVANTIDLRPVINLKSNIEFVVGGDGTQNNPYIVK